METDKKQHTVSDELKAKFFAASWRQKLNYWTSPAGKGHTLAHLNIALDDYHDALVEKCALVAETMHGEHSMVAANIRSLKKYDK